MSNIDYGWHRQELPVAEGQEVFIEVVLPEHKPICQQVPTGGNKHPVFSMIYQTVANRVCVQVSQLFFYFGLAVHVKTVKT